MSTHLEDDEPIEAPEESGTGTRSAPRIRDDEPADGDGESEALEGAEAVSESEPPVALSRDEMKRVIESLIFVADHPVTAVQLGRIVKLRMAEVKELVAEIAPVYAERGIELVEVAGGYQFRSVASSARWVRVLVQQRPSRLTRAQLETLALVAYRQPVTRPEVEEVRGVDSGSSLGVLLDRGLLKILGRKDEPGRPLLYGTTPYFLEFFGLAALKDLPTLREFTDLSEDSRSLFKQRTGQSLDEAESELAAGEGAEPAAFADAEVGPDEDLEDEDFVDVDAALREARAIGKRLSIGDDEGEPAAGTPD